MKIVSNTWKDSRHAKMQNWMSVFTPSEFNRWRRKQARVKAAQDLRNGREPAPRYPYDLYW